MYGRFKIVAASAAVVLVVAACSSSASKGGGNSTAAPASSANTGAQTALQKQAVAAATAAGAPMALPAKTIGYVRYAAVSEGDQRMVKATQKAAETIGWKVVICDGAGTPSKFDACGLSLLNQHVDVLMTDGIPPAQLAQSRAQAKTMGVPVISMGGTLSPTERKQYAAAFDINDAALGKLLSGYLATKLKSGAQVGLWGYPAFFGAQREDQLKSAVSTNGWKLVDSGTPNAADMVGSSKSAYQSKLIQFPKLGAVWCTFDASAYGVGQAVNAKYPGKQFPAKPLVVTFLADPTTIEQIRLGIVDATAEENLEWVGWVAVDQAAELIARKTPPSQDERPDYQGLHFDKDTIVTKDNLPDKGKLVPSPIDYAAFFTAKWHAEFNR